MDRFPDFRDFSSVFPFALREERGFRADEFNSLFGELQGRLQRETLRNAPFGDAEVFAEKWQERTFRAALAHQVGTVDHLHPFFHFRTCPRIFQGRDHNPFAILRFKIKELIGRMKTGGIKDVRRLIG